MSHLVVVVGLATVVVAGSALARRLGLLSPIVLVVVGIALSFVEALPAVRIGPEVILIGILPPLLYVAAVETSVPAFRVNIRPILLLAIGLVLFTAASVAAVTHALLPGLPWAAAFALGAVVAPPDAVAATAVARRVGLPRRVVTILEGESLINDATALVIFRVAVVAAATGSLTLGDVALNAVLASVGGVAIGLAGGFSLAWVHRRIKDPLLENAVSLLAPFLVYAPAEWLHASGVVAVVVTGLYLGHLYPELMSAASRLQMDAFWRMVKFLLEGAVFLLVGLQLRFIVADLGSSRLELVALITVAVVAVVIITRFVWMYPATYLARLIPRVRERDPAPQLRYPTVIAWAGMRGVVTLATALALPATLAGGAPYPRALFVWLAFAVIVFTLVLQGLTLPAVARRLRIPPDDPQDDALAEAAVQQAAVNAGRRCLEAEVANGTIPEEIVHRLRSTLDDRANVAWERLGGRRRETPSEVYSRIRRAMLQAERDVFRRARDDGKIAEEVLRRAQRDMDLEESLLQREE